MSDNQIPFSPGVQELTQAASDYQAQHKHEALGLNHWLVVLLSSHKDLSERISSGLDARARLQDAKESVEKGDIGQPFSLEDAARESAALAAEHGKQKVYESDIAAVILKKMGLTVQVGSSFIIPNSSPSPTSSPSGNREDSNGTLVYAPKHKQSTPALDEFGVDLTRKAAQGKLSDVVGRESEIKAIMETLCRRTKRNPALVGPAGTGKTALVEGLALRIVRQEVPEFLKGIRLVAVEPTALTAGAGIVGQFEERVRKVLQEASQEGIVLFIDEMHTIMGTGGRSGAQDLGQMLKPVLARGEVACIAATTDEEYRRFIEEDTALERRFQPVRITPLSRQLTRSVLERLRDGYAHDKGITVSDGAIDEMLDSSERFLRNRYFPDKAVDVFEQCVAAVLSEEGNTVDTPTVINVLERMVGMPLAWESRLEDLQKVLTDHSLLSGEDAQALIQRLTITMAGLDIHPERPNAVVLVSSDDPGAPSALASTLARVCFGDDERVVSLDLSSYVEEYSISRLLGSSAGYVGYGDTTPLWPIAQMPWCVLHLQGLEMCHPAVLGMIAQAVKDGRFSMSTGRRIHVSDTIVILSATSVSRPDRSVGFRPHTVDNSELMDDQEVIQSSGLGPEWTSVIDMVVHTGHQNPDSTHTVEEGVTQDFVDRFAEEGVDISWKSEALAWLADNGIHEMPHHQKELLIENALGPHLASIVSDRRKGGAEQTTSYVVTVVDGQLILSAKEKRD